MPLTGTSSLQTFARILRVTVTGSWVVNTVAMAMSSAVRSSLGRHLRSGSKLSSSAWSAPSSLR